MRVVLFGCKDTTLHVARFLKELCQMVTLVTISQDKGAKQEVAGYVNLSLHGDLFEQIYIARRYDLKSCDDLSFFKSINCDLGIAIGWQRLVPENILDLFRVGVFGMHGSAQDLPFGRGRSPLNWSIIEGRRWFYTNLFKYQAGVDDGPILDTECFSINEQDTAESLHYKITLSLINLIHKNLVNFTENRINIRGQKVGVGSCYPKRNPSDGRVDWTDSIFNIERLIRAVSRPFYGAFSYVLSKEVRIYRSAIFYTDLEMHKFKDKAYGEICDVFPNGKFLVRCNGGVLIVHDFESSNLVLSVGQVFESGEEKVRRFPRNKHGFFDCY
jgi:methionyl-tRNA formyltransferase